MKYTKLPNTDIKVSKICLGTMTWGNQNTQVEAFEQMNYALEQGVNFFDAAELYPVPAKPETYGGTEKIIGNWFKKTGKRKDVVLATKIAGSGDYTAHIRKDGFSKRALKEAIENSLNRLQTDYIDLYQLHWPSRGVNCFGIRDFPTENAQNETENYLEILETLNEYLKKGMIRSFGISNETPWGTMQYMNLAEQHNLPKPVTIQNSYSMIHKGFEIGMSEVCLRENIGLLAYSPLAQGVLTGKYLNNNLPEGARGTLYPRFIARYRNEGSENAVQHYLAIAKKYDISLTKLSLAFINQLPFITANIIGATKMEQLKENIDSINVELSEEVLQEIEEVHKMIPNPAP